MDEYRGQVKRASYLLIPVFIVIASGIVAAGYISYENLSRQHRAQEEDQLQSIAALKLYELTEWRQNSLKSAGVFYGNQAFSSLVKDYLKQPDEPAPAGRILSWLGNVCEGSSFDRASLLDRYGRTRLTVPDSTASVSAVVEARSREVLKTGKVSFVDFYRSEYDGRVYLSVLVPVLDEGADGTALGVVSLRIDPERYLYPYIRRWPTPSNTAETLVIRREGSSALYLNELRFGSNTALRRSIPLTEKDKPAVQAVLGRTGIVEGTDYRGMPVIAYVCAVPGSPWFLVARMDIDEAMAPMRERLRLLSLFAAALILAVGFALGLLWRHQRVLFYRERLQKEQALREAEARFRAIYQQSPIAIELYDDAGLLVAANPACLDLFGVCGEEEIRGFSLFDDPNISGDQKDKLRQGVEVKYEACFDFGKVRELNLYQTSKQGIIWLDVLISPLMQTAGQPGYMAQVQDITGQKRFEEALRESEEKHRFITETIMDVILTTDLDGFYTYISPSHEKILGRGVEVLGRSVFEHVHPDDVVMSTGVFQEALATKTVGKVEHRYLHPERGYIWLESQGIASEINGKLTGVIASRDITDRKRAEQELREAEEALKESEERYRRITESVSDYIFIVKVEDGVPVETVHSPSCEAVTGYTAAEFASNPYLWFTMVHPDDRGEVKLFARAIIAGEPTRGIEHRIVRKDGSIRWVLNTPVPRYDNKNRLISYDGVITDITERKSAEEALRASEFKYRTLFDSSSDSIIIFAFDGRILDVNHMASGSLGFTREALLGMTLSDLILPVLPDGVTAMVRKIIENGHETFEAFLATRGGGMVPVEVSSRVIEYEGLQAVLSIARDVTERHRAEEEKRKLEDQLIQAQKMEAVGQLAGGVAHDFNNLLTPILGYSEVILENMHPGDPRHNYLSEIQKAADSARNLTRQLLAFSRKQVLEIKPMDLNRIVSGFEKILRRTMRENITLRIRKADSLGLVNVDAGQIEQILMNLAVNAQDAMPAGGVLTIETGGETPDEGHARAHPEGSGGPFITLRVSDTGTGMEKGVAEHIFEPFFTTKESGRGTGLGLSTVYGIVMQHGGVIDVESEPGRGTCFRIFFPRVELPEAAHEEPVEAHPRKTGTETVLVTEDSESVRKLACEILRNHGYTVISARDGSEGLRILSDPGVRVDLLLTDVIMPGINGRDLYLQAVQVCPGLKVIYMSGYTEDVIARHGFLEPGVDLISKPFSMAALTDRVRDVLDR
jgi:two-component system, cell cycle sensor histidine kinase and response regulator CckA